MFDTLFHFNENLVKLLVILWFVTHSVEACPEALSIIPSFKKQKTCDFQTTTNTSSANGGSDLDILGMGHLKLIYIMM